MNYIFYIQISPTKIERGVRTHVQCRFSNFDMNHHRLPITSGDILQFRRRLLRWYDRHKRDLPWRQDRDAYRVWLSEIMLQQTRVAAVVEHYHRFLRKFPTVRK